MTHGNPMFRYYHILMKISVFVMETVYIALRKPLTKDIFVKSIVKKLIHSSITALS